MKTQCRTLHLTLFRLVALGCLVLALGVSGCGGPSYGEWLNSELKIDVKGGSYGKVRLGSGDFQRGDASVRAEVTMTQYWQDYPSCQMYLLLEGDGGEYQEKLDTSLIGKRQVAEFDIGMPGNYTLSYWIATTELSYNLGELSSCSRDNWQRITGQKIETTDAMLYDFSIRVTYKLPEP